MITRTTLGYAVAGAVFCAAFITHLPATATVGGADEAVPGAVAFRLRGEDAGSCSLGEVLARHDLALDQTILQSRRLHRARETHPDLAAGPKGAADLAKRLGKDECVEYAEADKGIELSGHPFHSWNTGHPTEFDGQDWRSQPAGEGLGLGDAHSRSDGAGVLIAILDTGVDAGHDALGGRTVGGWDYVDDDAFPTDEPCGCDTNVNGSPDDAVGHGTFVAGTTAWVAPGAAIVPMRVLDGDGQGSLFAVSQAIVDAADAGADVINLSLGTDDDIGSKVLEESLKYAHKLGALVVAAAGNGGDDAKHYPASMDHVLSVTALDASNERLADYSSYGDWVDVAATGDQVIGPIPGGSFVEWSGTSVAAPIVSGQLALVLGVAPDGKRGKVAGWVEDTAVKLKHVKVRKGRVQIGASLDRAYK